MEVKGSYKVENNGEKKLKEKSAVEFLDQFLDMTVVCCLVVIGLHGLYTAEDVHLEQPLLFSFGNQYISHKCCS